MAEIRLNKLTREFNVGLQTLVDFLKAKGADVEMNPNAKVSDEFIPELQKAFGGDAKAKDESERVQIKIKEIIEKGSKKKEDEEEEAAGGSTVIIRGTSGSGFAKEEPVQKPVEEAPKEVKPAVEETAAPEVQEAPKVQTAPEVVVETKPTEVPHQTEEVHAEPVVEAKPDAEVKPSEEAAPQHSEPVEVKSNEEVELPKAAEPTDQTPSEQAHANQIKKADIKKGDKTQNQKEFNPKVDKAKLKAEHKLQKAASSNDEDEPVSTGGLKIVGKVDLSKFEAPKKSKNKRERIAKGGSERVDVNKIDGNDKKDGNKKNRQGNAGGQNNGQNNGKKDFRQGGNNQPGQGKRRRDRGNDRFKPAMSEAEQEEMQKEIQKQVKETYARMNDSKSKNNFGAKHRKEKRELASQKLQEEMAQEAAEKKILKVTEFVTVNDLATLMNNTPVNKVIEACFSLGLMVSINQRLDAEALVLVAEEFGYKVEFVTADIQNEINQENDEPENEADLVTRPPIITVMGHVDHGKTSLLDYIRQTNVIAGEAGGITQHIGAYTVEAHGQQITFLDTPGHEAFTAMRMRGAKSTDIAILVVAADDGVMPQTVEAINHAKAAGIEIVVAINKIDKPSANIERVKQELVEYELIPEDWGGSTIFCPVSAHTGEGIDNLLDMLLLTAEILELKANPNRRARGLVLEGRLDKGKGPVATMLVQKGTLHVGDHIAVGSCHGKIRAMVDDKGKRIQQAGPSIPVEILGLNDVPNAGDVFVSPETEKEARSFAETFIREGREKLLEETKSKMSLDDLFSQIQAGNLKELHIIVKADVQGSVEAVKQSLMKLSNDEVVVKVIHAGVGAINESDVILASASNAIIIGFNVRPDNQAKAVADAENVDLRLYRVIYQAIEDVEAAMKGMLDPKYEEKVIGHAEVRQTYKASDVGTIAGSYVLDGVLTRGCSVRLMRGDDMIYDGPLASLKRFKDDAKEVKEGYECGCVLEKFNDIMEGDILEAYTMVEIPR